MSEQLWISDLQDGTYKNPIIFADYSDPDVIRVGELYYMVASSFNYTPGLPILISKDLVNWELVNYAIENINGSINYNIPAHSKGVWAPAIRYQGGFFYIYYGMPDDGIYMVKTQNPLGKWEDPICVLKGKGLIDPCPFWDTNGKNYIIHAYAKSRIGFKSYLGIFEINAAGTRAIQNDHILYSGLETQPTIEGPKVYKRGEYYYIFAPAGGVKKGWQTVLRSKNIMGPFEEKIVLCQGETSINGPHQGALIDTITKEEWFIHFQDRGAYGRIVHLQPVTWENGWPIIGIQQRNKCGNPCEKYRKPNVEVESSISYLGASDEFEKGMLDPMWQWTGNHYPSFYSLKERLGYLRLFCLNTVGAKAPTLWQCANILTEKMICPSFQVEVKMDISKLENMEKVGITVFGGQYAFLSVKKMEESLYLGYAISNGIGETRDEKESFEVIDTSQLDESGIFFILKIIEQVGEPQAVFSISFDGIQNYGNSFSFSPQNDTWVAAKIGIFAITEKMEGTGYVDVSYVHVEKEENLTMFEIAQKGNLNELKNVVEYSMESMNTKDSRGRGILHYGVLSGNLEVVTYLVEQVGMEILEGDENGITPFELAYQMNHKEIICFFTQEIGCSYEQMYKNPIRSGMFPDPSIVRVEDDYYMVNSSFVYFPSIPISHSRDLIHWEIIGYAISNPKWSNLSTLECGRGYWAPDISYHKGRFYITATYRMNDSKLPCRKQIVVSATRPEGPYSKPNFIEEDGIDPSLFWSQDGLCYMLLNRGARILQLTSDASKKIGEAKLIYYGNYKRAPEGPHVIEKDGYFYLFLAEGGTGLLHQITVARAKNLFGPYKPCPYNPIMTQKEPNNYLQRCGHGKPVKTKQGEWWMVYLCGRFVNGKYTMLGRETALDPISWTEDGWPIVNQLKGPSVIQKKPEIDEKYSNLLEKKQIHPNNCGIYGKWMTVREPDANAFRKEKEWTVIKGSKYEYTDTKSRNLYLQRRINFDFLMEANMKIPVLKEKQRTGIICYYDENSWCTFALIKKQASWYLELRQQMGLDLKIEEYCLGEQIGINEGKEINLKVHCKDLNYQFLYQFEGNSLEEVFALSEVTYLCDEGLKMGKRFTGTTIGVFAYAGEKEMEVAFKLDF